MLNFLKKNILTLSYCLTLITFYLFNVNNYFDLIILLFLLILFIIKNWNPNPLIFTAVLCLFLIPFAPNIHPPDYYGDPIGIDILAKYAFYLLIIYSIIAITKWKKFNREALKKSSLITVLVIFSIAILFKNEYWSKATIDVKSLSLLTSLSFDGKKFKSRLGELLIRSSKTYEEKINSGDRKHNVGFKIFIKDRVNPQPDNLSCLSFAVFKGINKLRGTGFSNDTNAKEFIKNDNVLLDKDKNYRFDWEIIEIAGKFQKDVVGTKILDITNYRSLRLRQYWPQKKELLFCFDPRFEVKETQDFIIPLEITFSRDITEYYPE